MSKRTTSEQPSDASKARTRGPSVLSQALYHRAIALPIAYMMIDNNFKGH